MSRVILRIDLPHIEVNLTADDPARWVGVFDGSVLVALAEAGDPVDTDEHRRVFLYVPADLDPRRIEVAVAAAPSELVA